MNKVGQIFVLVLMVVSSAAPGLADTQPKVQGETLLWPWIPHLPIDQDIQRCWSTIKSIEGCELEILNSLLGGRIHLGPACCKAISDISENCIPKMFSGFLPPFSPLFPPLLKNYCATVSGSGGVSSPPPPQPPSTDQGVITPPSPPTPDVSIGSPAPSQ